MASDAILETALAAETIALIVDRALTKYKIDREQAEAIVAQTILKHDKFSRLLETESSLKNIQKTRGFGEVNRGARQRMYYELRRYNKDIDLQKKLVHRLEQAARDPNWPGGDRRQLIQRLAHSHVSTRERLKNLDEFFQRLFDITGGPGTIIDIGCGMHPLVFPFDGRGKSVRRYAALDKDEICISALSAYSGLLRENLLCPLRWNIKDGWRTVRDKTGIQRFDAAFMMKLVPVIFRIERKLLEILKETPAVTWVLTGSKTSMTKHAAIEKRERGIIKRFIDQSGKKITGEFSLDEEFVLIVE
jgi:16S rRNA (guanine(1405)-N(7))-methyltransferase